MHRRVIDTLPSLSGPGDGAEVRRLVAASRRKAVVLDDDPTGTQTVHDVDVLADWSEESLQAALRAPGACFYVLTNTRGVPEAEAAERVRQACANLAAAAKATGVDFILILRGDSTLRGHFRAEIQAAEQALGGPADARIVIPAFFEGGRYTVGNVHFLADGDELVPVAQTEFARDLTFGYDNSDLARWIEEKTGGAVRASEVASIGIEELRAPGGAAEACRRILGLPHGAFLVVNAASYSDLETFTAGLLAAESKGRRFILRTAASFVRVRAGVDSPRPIHPADLGQGPAGPLVVVGSYVGKTTEQLGRLLSVPRAAAIEVDVGRLATREGRESIIGGVAAAATAAIAAGRTAVLYTSRAASSPIGPQGDLAAGKIVSEALVGIVSRISTRPRFILTKGGVTSCDVAVQALGMVKARVRGQAAPGVPVWEMGPETRWPGLSLVVWPGNVGGPDALRRLLSPA
jgi:uncharacterized protein YgbK (DUF1537 family)